MIFTGIYTRTEIIIAKMIKILSTCLAIFLLYEILSFGIAVYYGLNISLHNSFQSLLVFLTYGYMIGSFEFLVSSISLSGIASGVITYLCFFDIMNVLLSNALSSHISEILKSVIRNSIFYIANTGFYSQTYTIKEFLILFISASIILILSCVIFKRKNL